MPTIRRQRVRDLYLALAVAMLIGTVSLSGGCAAKPKPAQAKAAAFWPPYPDEPRVQYLTSLRTSSDIAPAKSGLDQLIYGKEQEQVLAVKKPYGVKMWNGRVYVCDLGNHCVTILDLRKKQTLVIGRGPENLQRPSDIDIAPDGTKYVADQDRGAIVVFDAQDRYVRSFAAPGFKPVGVAASQNELFVSDFAKQEVSVLARSTGQRLRAIGSQGQGPGQFIRPLGLSIDKDGNLLVVDVFRCDVQKFSPAGKLLATFGTISANAGGFVRPKLLASDKEGITYVVDAAFQNVQLFDQSGHPLTFFGSSGKHPGAMYVPAGVAVHDGDLDLFQQYVHPAFDAQRLIVVTNQFGDDRVAFYALGRLKPGKTVADISSSQGLVPTGTAEQKLAGVGAPLPPGATQPSSPGETALPAAAAAPTGTVNNK